MGGLKKPRPGAENTEPVFQIPVGLPSLERGRRIQKKPLRPYSRAFVDRERTVNRETLLVLYKTRSLQSESHSAQY